MIRNVLILTALLTLFPQEALASQQVGNVRIGDISRIDGVRENVLIGYGIVVGLAGSGDSQRSKATMQSVRNTLENFGLVLESRDINSRNAAAVLVTAQLPPFAQPGDKIDVSVSSVGDARSLTGGTLFMTPLKGIDEKIYALAQGALSVGGYKFEVNQNTIQRNHPTVGFIPRGALVEREVKTQFAQNGKLKLLLNAPDFVTADRIVKAVQRYYPNFPVIAEHAGKIAIDVPEKDSMMSVIANLQQILITPAGISRVVVNEKTGTIVAGSDVSISNVVISHAGIKLTVETDFLVSQPGGIQIEPSQQVGTRVVPDSKLKIETDNEALYRNTNAVNIAELVDALKSLKLKTRDIISILQALKQSGALHAELVVQ